MRHSDLNQPFHGPTCPGNLNMDAEAGTWPNQGVGFNLSRWKTGDEMIDIHPLIKFASVFFAAFVATCLCFYLMLYLIANELTADIDIITTSYVRPYVTEHEEKKPVATRKKPQKALPLQPPPDPSASIINATSRVALKAQKPTFGSIADLLGPLDIHLELEAPHSELTPLYVVQPIYPLRAAMKNLEGFVVVEFSVRANGTVSNPIVIDSQPGILFDQSALIAVSRFKFKPREIGGERVRVDKVQMKFSFNLESLYDVDEAYRK